MPRLSNPRPSWASSDDTAAFNLIVITIGAAVFSYLGWRSYHGQISAALMSLRHQEMLLLDHFTDRFRIADAQMLRADPSDVTVTDLYRISRAIGAAWRLPACILILILGATCARWAAPSRFKRRFDLDGLAAEQARTFRSPLAYLGLKLRLTPPSLGTPRPADYALTPDEWIERFAADPSDRAAPFDFDAARRALVRQLGPQWNGSQHASPHVQVLFTAFALHLNERREDAASLLATVSAALADAPSNAGEGPVDPITIPADVLAQVRLLGGDPDIAPAREITARHAYTAPALMSLLNAARTSHGVLAPAQFAWLKLVDRPLWYALHSLGFETDGVGRYLHPNPRAEAAGARDHWAAECALSTPLLEPSVTRALSVLERHAARQHRTSRNAGFVRRDPAHSPPETSA